MSDGRLLHWHRHSCLCSGAARSASSRAFTLIELLAILSIVVLLAATFVPYALSLKENERRVRCAANLGKIGWALSQYANANGGSYPRTRFDERLGNRWTAFTGADDANPFAANSAVQANDVTASLWLLVRTVDADPKWFVCPSSDGVPDRVDGDARSRGNFRSASHLTYSVASPFSSVADYTLRDTLPSNFVLVADQGPSFESLAQMPPANAPTRTLAMGNSVNHRRAGQNVLYSFGQVVFESTPYVGVGRQAPEPARAGVPAKPAVPGDNIYTALSATPLVDTKPNHAEPGAAGLNVGPSYRYDTYLVPPADVEASRANQATTSTRPIEAPSTLAATSPSTRAIEPTPPVATRPAPAATRPTTAPTTRPPATRAATAPATTPAAR